MNKPKIEVIDGDVFIQNVKFRQALEEIKEITKEYMSCEGESHPCPQSQDILEKINEVLNEK